MAVTPQVSSGRGPLRLLVLSPFTPRLDAPHGGGRSIAQFVSELGARHRVALLCLRAEGEPGADELVRERCELVEEFVMPGVGSTFVERWRRQAGLVYALARGRPMWVADCAIDAYAARVAELTRSWRPDVVQAEYHVMGQYFAETRGLGAARVLTEQEPGAAAADELWRGCRGLERLLLRADALAWRRFEARTLRGADAVVAYTERDRCALASLAADTKIVRIPLGTTIPAQPADVDGVEPRSLIFVGNFMHPPNVDTARRLLEGILPRILGRIPDVQLHLVGDRAPESLRRAAGANVTVTGYVDDVAPYLARAAVVVVPIRTGGGQRVKVIEALAAGKAIVGSRLALEGLDVADGDQVVLAETDEEFADAVVRLLADEVQRAALAARAREWAEWNLGWERAIEGYERLYEELRGSPANRL